MATCGCLGDPTATAYANYISFYTIGTETRKMSLSTPLARKHLSVQELPEQDKGKYTMVKRE